MSDEGLTAALAPEVDAWMWIDGADRVVGADPRTATRLAGRTLADALHPDDVDAVLAAMDGVRAGGQSATAWGRLRGRDGELAHVWQVLRAGGHLLIAGRCAHRDALSVALARARADLVVQLAPTVAHDANNSLGAVIANLRYVQGVQAGTSRPPQGVDEVPAALEDAIGSAGSTADLIAALRLLARAPQAGVRAAADVVRAAGFLVRYAVPQRMQIQVDRGAPLALDVHQGELVHLLVELLLAVGEVATVASDVEIGVAADAAAVEIRYVPGPGELILGWVSRTLLKRLDLQLGSEPGWLRVGRAAAAPPVERPRMLLIDDEPMLAAAVRRLVAGHFDVEVVTSGREALSRLARAPLPDLVLCDLGLPDVDGPDVFREQPPSVQERFVFTTGGVFRRETQGFLDSAGRPQLPKPFDLDQLLRVAAPILGR